MAGPEQQQAPQQGGAEEVAKLFQNVGQGLVLITQYVGQVAPQAQGLANDLMQGYEQLVQTVDQARQGGGQQPQQPVPQEAGSGQVQQAL
tara:strand:+ start:1667 stop:1936 length:270 start_codon:yes stop_codon:yes gene_type:complete